MPALHFEFLVEEPSVEAFLRGLLPKLLPADRTFEIHAFQGKHDLLGKLEQRLRGYARFLPADSRIVVLVDRDNDDCRDLKARLEATAQVAGFRTRSSARREPWRLLNRIAIEELEAWYFGDWVAVREAYPRVPATIPNRSGFRDPDAIEGGTWEAFERILQRHGYFESGLRKIEAARELGARVQAARSCSRSFQRLRDALAEAAA